MQLCLFRTPALQTQTPSWNEKLREGCCANQKKQEQLQERLATISEGPAALFLRTLASLGGRTGGWEAGRAGGRTGGRPVKWAGGQEKPGVTNWVCKPGSRAGYVN